ncbi:N-6 DNA methylase [Enterococcus sp. FR042]|uniref:N-6 DNA methylase n=1 Tax=Enterococcus sp. FR042 TaxID=2923492 RepID=UPI001927A82A|nr:N-6 DNA methylase [Enterococcus sp. FR042]MDQ8650685.1 N-6 DNA methylase [Enterococcus sp. FR042]HAP3436789.1 SAM-dependent DNA methyltransferase [Enterococcus faecalis]
MKLTTEKINELLGVDDAYKAPEALMNILLSRDKREIVFNKFLEIENDLTFDWFHYYFQDEHADRKVKKQDFTPNSIGDLLSRLAGTGPGAIHDVAAGTGGLTIKKWQSDRNSIGFFIYKPSMTFYELEELSDRAIPFLIFNLAIRGMNATIVHGDSLDRKIKQIYFLQNSKDDMLAFSDVNVMPHSDLVTREFHVREWLEEPIDHIESSLMTYLLPSEEDA